MSYTFPHTSDILARSVPWSPSRLTGHHLLLTPLRRSLCQYCPRCARQSLGSEVGHLQLFRTLKVCSLPGPVYVKSSELDRRYTSSLPLLWRTPIPSCQSSETVVVFTLYWFPRLMSLPYFFRINSLRTLEFILLGPFVPRFKSCFPKKHNSTFKIVSEQKWRRPEVVECSNLNIFSTDPVYWYTRFKSCNSIL